MDSPLRLARLSRGLTLEEAAALVDLDTSTLSRIERTGRTGRNTAARLAEVFLMSEEHVLYPERYARPESQPESRMSALCPVCRGELVVGGADVTDGGTRYGYWCPNCQEPRAPESGQAARDTSTGERGREA